MSYEPISPARLLSSDLTALEFTERPWTVRWDELRTPVEEVFRAAFPETLDFVTSGSTGQSRTWHRSRDQLWAEAGLVGGMIAHERPEAVLSFAPPRHLYGMIVSALVPARLGLPVWYRPQFAAMPPEEHHRRWAVMAIPWTFRILQQRLEWARAMEHISLVHSTATLPAAARDLLSQLNDAATLLELFGSTETGAVATRRAGPENRAWQLCPDVRLVHPPPGEEGPLAVRSPRLARPLDGPEPQRWEMDDWVKVLDEDTIELTTRRGRLVNVNGRRLDLDRLEEQVRAAVRCADAACVPVADPLVGEHFDVLVVASDGAAPADMDLAPLVARLERRPRRVVLVDRIDRSETGKLRHIQSGTQLGGDGAS